MARLGSFTAAAQRLGYTQSAVSQQIAALEAELGQQLVRRRPVETTPAGRRLVEHATHVLLRLDVAATELRQIRRPRSSTRLSVSPLASRAALGRIVAGLFGADPNLDLSLTELDGAAAVAAVAAGHVDAAIVDGLTAPLEPLHLTDSGLLSARFLVESEVVIVLPADHPLARRRRLALDTVVDGPWIAAPRLTDPGVLARLGVAPSSRPRAVYEGSDVTALLAMVAAGTGAALLPRHAVQHDAVVAVPLARPQLSHRSELLALRTSSLPLDGLAAAAR